MAKQLVAGNSRQRKRKPANLARDSRKELSGKKYDTGKAPLSLIPKPALIEVAKVLKFGAERYSPWNWSQGFEWSRLISAADRHLWAFEQGEDSDPETGLSHLAHSTCCLLFLLTHSLFDLGIDDRKVFSKILKKKTK